MHALHRRNHTKLTKARNVCWRQMLCVLNAPSQVRAFPAVRPENLFIDVQHLH